MKRNMTTGGAYLLSLFDVVSSIATAIDMVSPAVVAPSLTPVCYNEDARLCSDIEVVAPSLTPVCYNNQSLHNGGYGL